MTHHDMIVIGGGPGGYVAAIRAAQLGLNVACVEREPALGGTCLRVGCIPSKALLEASQRYLDTREKLAEFGVVVQGVGLDLARLLKRKDDIVQELTQGVAHLFKKNRVTRYFGHGKIVDQGRIVVEGDGLHELQAPHIILATGSQPANLAGVQCDGARIGNSTDALNYSSVPRHLIVIGAGYIGLELGAVWRRLGADVTMVEYLDRVLPGMDRDLSEEAERIFERQGIRFRLRSAVTRAEVSTDGVRVEIDGQDPVEGDRVLVCVGRIPNTQDLGIESVGLELDGRGRIPVDAQFCTYVKGIYAIGDVIRGPMLAHKASDEGIACVEQIVTGYGHVNYDAIPGIVYTHPEIATVGKSEDELRELKIPYKKGLFPFSANGRARTMGCTEGRIKMLAHAETDRILGVHVIGPHAGDLIAEAAVAIEFGASSEDLALAAHAHPTLSEALKEAALAVQGRPINI